MSLPTLIAWLVVVLVVVGVAAISGRALRLRWTPVLIVAVLAATATVAILLVARLYKAPRPVQVIIVSPRGGADVSGTRIRVAGTVAPEGATVMLLVRSERDLHWWPQDRVTKGRGPGNIGTWSVDAHLGTERQGPGESFIVLAVASNDPWIFNLLTDRWINLRSVQRTVPRWGRSEPAVIYRIR